MLAKRVVLILISLVITACSDSNEGVAPVIAMLDAELL